MKVTKLHHLPYCMETVAPLYYKLYSCVFHCPISLMHEPSPRHDDESDPHLESTMAAVDWNAGFLIAVLL